MATTTFTQDQLEEALEFVGLDNATVDPSYSGRRMYGATCFGIVHQGSPAFVTLAILHAVHIAQETKDHYLDVEVTAEIMVNAREDNMGLSSITYFPYWQLKVT